jgi:predicted DsbA family dithiol-disulfide isomerase/uncharacterized membrane protein
LLLVALALSAMLFADSVGEGSTFCGATSGCAAIRATAWGALYGVPIPLIGLVAFSGLLALSLSPAQLGRRVFAVDCVVSGLIGLTLLGVQAFVLRRFCQLCVGVDLATVGAAMLAPIYVRRADSGAARPPLLRGFAILILGIIAVIAPLGWPKVRPAPPIPDVLRALYQPDVVNVVEVADFQCPHCRAFHPHLKAAIASFGGPVNFVRVHYPLSGHAYARDAALAHLCADDAGHGEEMANLLFTTEDLSPDAIISRAPDVGLGTEDLRRCMAGVRARERLREHLRIVRSLSVSAVPTTFIGHTSIRGGREEDEILADLRRAASGEGLRGIPDYLYLTMVAVAIALVILLARRKPEET